MADLDVNGVLNRLDEYEENSFSPVMTTSDSGSDSEPSGGTPTLTGFSRSHDKNRSLQLRTPDASCTSVGARLVHTDPVRNKVGSRRGARYWSESSGDESSNPALQQLKKTSSHKKAKRQSFDGALSSYGGRLAPGNTPKTTATHRTVKKSVSRQISKQSQKPVSQGDKSVDGSATGSVICAQLGEITNLLQTLDKRVATTEKELKSIKTKLRSTSSSESSTKESVPLTVRVRLHVYDIACL